MISRLNLVKPTSQFKKDYKKIKKQGKNLLLLETIIDKLANGKLLDQKYRDHALQGKYNDCRECHIAPDWLLIYSHSNSPYILLIRTGSHSELF